jgi:hypothetical protein
LADASELAAVERQVYAAGALDAGSAAANIEYRAD